MRRHVRDFVAAGLCLIAIGCGSGSDDLEQADGSTTTAIENEMSTTETDAASTENSESSTTSGATAADTTTSTSDEPTSTTDDTTAETTSTEAESTTTASTTTTTSSTTTTTTTTTPTTTTIPSTALERIPLGVQGVADLVGPVAATVHPSTGELWVVEQRGRIVRIGADGADTVLNLGGRVSSANEQGLLGLAITPDGRTLFTNHTDGQGDTLISRWSITGTSVDEVSEATVIGIGQPRGNHNGGQLAIGPDGHLWIGLGDGGGGGDPFETGQDPSSLLGSILRLDISDPTVAYAIPADNPFVDGGGAPEVFVWGIRNAWQFSFDPANGDLWVADVGQDRFEEVTVARSSTGRGNGANFGWNEMEGAEPYRSGSEPADHVGPIVTYAHAGGRCSITGGQVYRGRAIPALVGTYVFGDFCTGEIFGFRSDGSSGLEVLNVGRVGQLSNIVTDASGELIAISRGGDLLRIVPG